MKINKQEYEMFKSILLTRVCVIFQKILSSNSVFATAIHQIIMEKNIMHVVLVLRSKN